MSDKMATIQRKSGDHGMEAVHEDDRAWETPALPRPAFGRCCSTRIPTKPERAQCRLRALRAGVGRHPLHRHDFAQIWYITAGSSSRSAARPTAPAR